MEESTNSLAERFQRAVFTTFKQIGPDLMQSNKSGLTRTQFFLMQSIWKSKQCRQTELAEMMDVKPSAITVIIDRLENNGYVIRKSDAKDRRVVLVELTKKGEETLEEVRLLRLDAINQLLSRLPKEEAEAFLLSFEKLARISSDDSHTCMKS